MPFEERKLSRIAQRAMTERWARKRERLETCWMILTFVAFFAACAAISLATVSFARAISTSVAIPIAAQIPARFGG